jgi:transposase
MKSAQTQDRKAKARSEYLASMRRFSSRRAGKNPRAQRRSEEGRFTSAMEDNVVRAMHEDYMTQGFTYAALSAKYGFSRSGIHEAFRRLGLPTTRNKASLESLPPETTQEMIRRYAEGDSIGALRQRFALRAQNARIVEFLRRQGVSIRTRAEEEALKWQDRRAHIPQIIAEYRKGDSVTTLAKRYSVTPSFCLRWLRRNGVAIRCAHDEIYVKSPLQRRANDSATFRTEKR